MPKHRAWAWGVIFERFGLFWAIIREKFMKNTKKSKFSEISAQPLQIFSREPLHRSAPLRKKIGGFWTLAVAAQKLESVAYLLINFCSDNISDKDDIKYMFTSWSQIWFFCVVLTSSAIISGRTTNQPLLGILKSLTRNFNVEKQVLTFSVTIGTECRRKSVVQTNFG